MLLLYTHIVTVSDETTEENNINGLAISRWKKITIIIKFYIIRLNYCRRDTMHTKHN